MLTKGQQLAVLKDQIIGNVPSTGEDKFFVYPIEAGLGKTTTTFKALRELHEKDKSVKSIFVTKLIDEVKTAEKALRGIGVAVYTNNIPDNRTIMDATVLIITHAKYIQLCNSNDSKSRAVWRLYSTGRSNLIIDEELEFLNIVTINDAELFVAMRCVEILDYNLSYRFDKACGQLGGVIDRFHISPNNYDEILEMRPCDISPIDDAINLIESTKKWSGFYETLVFLNTALAESYTASYKELIDFIYRLKSVLSAKKIIINRKGIHAVDEEFEYKMLDNNIILDASASMNPI